MVSAVHEQNEDRVTPVEWSLVALLELRVCGRSELN